MVKDSTTGDTILGKVKTRIRRYLITPLVTTDILKGLVGFLVMDIIVVLLLKKIIIVGSLLHFIALLGFTYHLTLLGYSMYHNVMYTSYISIYNIYMSIRGKLKVTSKNNVDSNYIESFFKMSEYILTNIDDGTKYYRHKYVMVDDIDKEQVVKVSIHDIRVKILKSLDYTEDNLMYGIRPYEHMLREVDIHLGNILGETSVDKRKEYISSIKTLSNYHDIRLHKSEVNPETNEDAYIAHYMDTLKSNLESSIEYYDEIAYVYSKIEEYNRHELQEEVYTVEGTDYLSYKIARGFYRKEYSEFQQEWEYRRKMAEDRKKRLDAEEEEFRQLIENKKRERD